METFVNFTLVVLFCGFVRSDSLPTNSTGNPCDVVVKRQKRFLVFEKGASFTGNAAKSVISGSPRGLNEIFEYTVVYELPTGLDLIKKISGRKTTTSTTTTRPTNSWHSPYAHRRHSKCTRWNFFESNGQLSKMCLRRTKRVVDLHQLSISERMFYDIIEKWSNIHGFVSRHCFMRTLCEARHLLLPNGHSLLHDIIHIFLSYTTPWAAHHETFGRSLSRHHSLTDCGKLYGPHCRVSWLSHVTREVHGSRADFVL